MRTESYLTRGGVRVTRQIESISYKGALEPALSAIDHQKGCVFASGYEYPGRYSRWDLGFYNPPLELIGRGREFRIRALNEKGRVLLQMVREPVLTHPHVERLDENAGDLEGKVSAMPAFFAEEDRSKQPSLFSVLRAICGLFFSKDDSLAGLYGAFAYDLVFQFEPIDLRHERSPDGADLHLFLPDEILVIDHRKEQAERRRYEFCLGDLDTQGKSRKAKTYPCHPGVAGPLRCDHETGEYARKVEEIREGCRQGDFFEVVLSQVFTTGYAGSARQLFDTVCANNPSPYEFFINLGEEQLIGASPEMYVRVEDNRVETCPISGTIPRGEDPLEDAKRIHELLNSEKDEAELTMCTDVDRNDKSRVCVPGSVQVKGRRLIESYSRLFHTVDHVEGELLPGYDAFDAFLTHMWACTLTGAPKPAAMQKIEDLENSARGWYGGAVGWIGFSGGLNTGITIRTIRLHKGKAEVRVGATLLVDSEPEEEERETRTKAAAFVDVVMGQVQRKKAVYHPPAHTEPCPKVLFVDHRDSFVHTLANYFRQCHADVTTLRAGFPLDEITRLRPDLVFLSPGPGRPSEFGMNTLLSVCDEREIPCFGVCLGLQGMVEYFGGELGVLPHPWHGRPSRITHDESPLFSGFPGTFQAGRYHSLFAKTESLPKCLRVTATSEDSKIMAIEHTEKPFAAVQFHPESILTSGDQYGLRLVSNAIRHLAGKRRKM